MGLRAFIIKRAIFSFFLILFVITLNFIIFDLMPGDPWQVFIHPDFDKYQIEAISHAWGLDQPMHVRYFKYVQNLLTWQFGTSFRSGSSVAGEMTSRLTNTLSLVGIATVSTILIGIPLGAISAFKRGKLIDTLLVTVSTTLNAFPAFWMGMMLLLGFAFTLRWFPSSGNVPPAWAGGNWPTPLWVGEIANVRLAIPSHLEILGRLHHLVLPVAALVIVSYGSWLLFARATVMEVLTEDYIVTARAKGLKERTVLFKHALKNASLPLVTSVAISFGFLIGGAIITEQVFTYPGMGEWIWRSISQQDYPVMQAIFYVIAICVILANFTADLVYGIIDPRIKYR